MNQLCRTRVSTAHRAASIAAALALAAALAVFPAPPAAAQRAERSSDQSSAQAGPADATASTTVPTTWLYLGGVATEPQFTDSYVYDFEGIGFSYEGDHLSLGFEGGLVNDEKYSQNHPMLRGRYALPERGTLGLQYGRVGFQGGLMVQEDEIDSPYSLFFSSEDLSTMGAELRYSGDYFSYATRWLELNRDPALYDLERGANYKLYQFDFGRFRVGVQEAVVYLGDSFYPEYFFSPVPMFATQFSNSLAGTPWQQQYNENSLVGFFLEYDADGWSSYGQFFGDDWNEMGLEWIVPDASYNQPSKFAWAVGGRLETAFGTVGLHQAGASKFTFGPTYSTYHDYNSLPYSYTYYPKTEYIRDGETLPILPEDNYIGYVHGENNVAVSATYESPTASRGDHAWDYGAGAEYTISGSKAPTNPWHEADWHANEGTKFLDESPLEHEAVFELNGMWKWKGFELRGAAQIGGVWNELALQEVPGAPEESRIFKPTDTDRFLWEISLEVRYVFGLGPRE